MATSLHTRLAFGVLAFAFALPTAQGATSDDDLSAKATDPTASLMSLQLNDWYTARFHGADGSSNQAVLRAAIPFSALGTNHIFRVTQPFVTSNSLGRTGAVDTTLFDLMVFDMPWGRWGAGVVGVLPTGASGLTTDKWSFGPAIGFVNNSQKIYNFGLFVQSAFSVAGKSSAPDVGFVNLQPIFSYQLGGGRSVGLGNSALVYDTEKSKWTSLQASVSYGQVVTFWGHKWRPNAEVGYDFKDDPGNPKWVIRAGINLLLPTN